MTLVFVVSHPGLGDHILCNGLYRQIALKYETCYVSATKNYERTVSRMLSDVSNLEVIPFGNRLYEEWLTAFIKKANDDMKIIKLGYFGENNFLVYSALKYDENFYMQAGVDFSHRWKSFYHPRDSGKEKFVYEKLIGKNHKFIFLHEDKSRGYTVSDRYLRKDVPIITPSLDKKMYTIFDYRLVLERAQEIHCIESSFCAYVESLENSFQDLYAHRYCRPEAVGDSRLEFSYRKNWKILLTK